MWVIGEARALADEVTIFLSENTLKKPQFSAEERKRIVELSAAERGWDNVQVVIVKSDYTARVAKKRGIDYLIRRDPQYQRFRLRKSDPANQCRRIAGRQDHFRDAAARPRIGQFRLRQKPARAGRLALEHEKIRAASGLPGVDTGLAAQGVGIPMDFAKCRSSEHRGRRLLV